MDVTFLPMPACTRDRTGNTDRRNRLTLTVRRFLLFVANGLDFSRIDTANLILVNNEK